MKKFIEYINKLLEAGNILFGQDPKTPKEIREAAKTALKKNSKRVTRKRSTKHKDNI